MSFLFKRSNEALDINPPTGTDFHISKNGSDWLWAVCAVYCFSLLVVVALAYVAKSGERIFHYLYTISLFTGAVAYFTMASDLGWTPVETSNNEKGIRQVFYAKYINWFVGWTPLIIALSLISCVSWATIIYNVALSWVWISSWLAGSLVRTSYKWGFFTFGTFAFLLLSISLVYHGSLTARRLTVKLHYLGLSGWLVTMWFIYPIAWGVDEGNEISVTSGFIIYGILDILTVPLLAFATLALASRWDYRELNLYFTQYGRVAHSEGTFPEKAGPAGGPAGGPATRAGEEGVVGAGEHTV